MECASDVSIQRRRICCTVIWIGDAQSTYLLNFLTWQRAKPRTLVTNFIYLFIYLSVFDGLGTFGLHIQSELRVTLVQSGS